MGAPVGNSNATKAKPWTDAIRRALARAELDDSPRSLNNLADRLLDAAVNGDLTALKELGDRLDGKAVQQIAGDPDGAPVAVAFTWLKPSE